MNLKNRTSNTTNTFDKIQKILSEHKAQKMMFEYKDGLIEAINFSILINEKEFYFKLPSHVENVFHILYGKRADQYRFQKYLKSWKEQAYKTAWANIRDWIDAQMALIDMKQVKIEEVMLPFLIVKGGGTLFQQMEESQFLLGNGENQ